MWERGLPSDPRSPLTCLLLLIPRPSTLALPPGQACCTAHSPPALQVSPRSRPPGSQAPAPPTPCGLQFPSRHLSGPRGLPLRPPRPSWFLSLPGPCPTLALPPLPPSICLRPYLSVSVALSPSVHLSVTPSALPCSPLFPLILARSFPICPPSPPSPQGPLPLDTD